MTRLARMGFWRSLRGRLLLSALLVETLMLTLLVANNLRLLDDHMTDQVRERAAQLRYPLEAAVVAPLAQRDYATLQSVIEETVRSEGIDYMVLFDSRGRRVAASGWNLAIPLPRAQSLPHLSFFSDASRFDTALDVQLAGQAMGRLHYGINLRPIQRARARLFIQASLIALGEVLLSALLLSAIGLWLTRKLVALTRASESVAAGELALAPLAGGDDELGRLGAAFNTMSNSVHSRIQELIQARDQQHQATQALRGEHARLSSLLSAMNIGILFEDRHGRVEFINPAFRQMWAIDAELDLMGMPTDEVLNHSAHRLSRPDHASRHVLRVLDTHEISERFEVDLADGRVLTQVSYPVAAPEGQTLGRLWIYEDVTHERQTAQQLLHLAERDPLTGLSNRYRFQEHLEKMIDHARRGGPNFALLYFDLDEFKYVNDSFGHRAGDTVLVRVAGEVSNLVRGGEMFARLGGDEFAVLADWHPDDKMGVLPQRILQGIAAIPFRFKGANLRLTASVGVAIFPEHGDNAEDLVAHADAAMYQAKHHGKNTWMRYDASQNPSDAMVDRLTWGRRIDLALEQNLFELHFQGIYRASDRGLAHYEALVRMRDPGDPAQLIMPSQFIPKAEKGKQIVAIDHWVLRESLRILAERPDLPGVAVNISGRTFDDPALPHTIRRLLKESGVAPRRLLLEVTETAAIANMKDAQDFIQTMRDTGCRLCLDDFGSGFSSFAYLKLLDVDVLKIDAMFVRDLPHDPDSQVFIRAMVDVGRGLGKQTVAEGVENEAVFEILRQAGVDEIQGYLFGRPEPLPPIRD